jgi:seryl-tRNA synthetase
MHDIKFIRENPDAFDAGLKRRGLAPLSKQALTLDEARRHLQTELQGLQENRNKISKTVGELKAKGGDASAALAEVATIKQKMEKLEANEKEHAAKLEEFLAPIPNLPAPEVPEGKDEKDNKEIRRVGEPRKISGAKEHYQIGEKLGLMDFETAAKISGARFVFLKSALARLERALANFMLDIHTTEFGYTEVSPPLLVKTETMFGTGQLPKFRDDQFHTNHGLWLIPTSEVPLTNMVNDAIVDGEALPMRVTAKTPCFRAEAGAAGKDTHGMLRHHQFYKVELVSITRPEQSDAEHERMTECAETILKRLELPFRTIMLCTGDMGFSAKKTYDLEVWLPGQNTYREISSCSNCGDFQARRMKARFRAKGEKGTQFVHTLNGSGVAVGRCLIAVLENYQQDDGSVVIPPLLRPYMGGLSKIEPRA